MRFLRAIIFLTVLGCLCSARAQWMTQTISLSPGWNAVYLEIQPEPRSCDVIFSKSSVTSIHGWNRRFSSVQFIQDTEELIAKPDDWLIWVPTNHPITSQRTLYSLEGGKTYLIKTPSNSGNQSVILIGKPTTRSTAWLGNSYTLAGFPVGPNPPTFRAFFGSSSAHSNSPIYRLNSGGQWLPVSVSSTAMRSGEAFWIYTTGESTYTGPLQLTMDQSTGLDYGTALTEQTLRIKKLSGSIGSIVVRQLVSSNPPAGPFPALAGGVPLSWWNMNFSSNQFWVPFPSQLTNASLSITQGWALRLAVQRTLAQPYSGTVGAYGALYENILEVSDTAGSLRYRVPMTAQTAQTKASQFGIQGLPARPLPGSAQTNSSPYALAGLWVGSASINTVSQPPSTNPVPTASEFQLRLIFHCDNQGKAQLLQEVFQMWTNGTTTNDLDNIASVDRPGRYVLVTDRELLGQLSGSTIRDGATIGRRYSSAAFGFDNSVTNVQGINFGTNDWSCRVINGFDDATNPFKHKYHPDHNNLDEDYVTFKKESFDVTRDISLHFTTNDPDGLILSGWNDTEIGGYYSELITGLHRNPLKVSGTFRLRHASTVATLNQ